MITQRERIYDCAFPSTLLTDIPGDECVCKLDPTSFLSFSLSSLAGNISPTPSSPPPKLSLSLSLYPTFALSSIAILRAR